MANFIPSEHLIPLKGKDYLEVKWRLVWFREEKPLWGVETDTLELTDQRAVFKATVKNEEGRTIAVGHGSETPRDFGDYIEKAETKAIGRALALLGYGTQFAPELEEGDRIVDSPVEKKKASVALVTIEQAKALKAAATEVYGDSYAQLFTEATGYAKFGLVPANKYEEVMGIIRRDK